MSTISHHGVLLAATLPTDPHWGNVVSLLNFFGSDGSTSTTDSRGLPWAFQGNAQIDTDQSVNGVSSLLLDGTGDYIQTADIAQMRSDVSIFTIEAYVRLAGSKLQTVFNKRSSTMAQELSLYINADNTISFQAFSAGSAVMSLSGAAMSLATWHHLEVGRNGTSWYLFVDGALQSSGTQSGAPQTNNQPFRLGRDGFNTARDLNGWIGGFRRTNGVIRHTSSFTPPTAPFPTS